MIPAALGWCCLAAAVLAWPRRAGSTTRIRELAGTGRLVAAPRARRAFRLPGRGLGARAAPAVAAAAILPFAGPALAVALAGALLAGQHLARSAVRRRRDIARRAAVHRTLGLLADELAAGSRPEAALDAAAEACPDLAPALRSLSAAQARGQFPPADGYDPDLAGVARAWQVATTSGAPLAAVLRRVAVDVASDIERHRRIDAALAGPRASAALLAALPVLGLGLGAALGVRPLAVLVGTPAGRLLCCTGVLLDVAGLLVTHRILRGAGRP